MTPNDLNAEAIAAQTRVASSRRHFLRGLGAAVALPALESILPKGINSAVAAATRGLGTTPNGAPLRMAVLYVPNGVNQKTWWPTGEGNGFELNKTMAPLAELKDKVQVFGGLDHQNATGGKDGPGDHARASSVFLTGVRIKKTAGADIHAGLSVDQLIAGRIGHQTRFPSLELTCDGVRKSGGCDSGYSCAYDFNMSWRSPTSPMAPEPNPRMVFERLFGAGPAGERSRNYARRIEQQKSILDFVLDDARDLGGSLASRDKAKLDEYLTCVRDVEARIQRSESLGEVADPGSETPAGIPASYRDHIRLMCDMMVLAFQTDSTRIATLIMAHDGSNRAFPEIGIPEGHHFLSHHPEQGRPTREGRQDRPVLHGRVCPVPRQARGDQGCRRPFAAPQFDGHLRRRQRRRQPPQSRQSAVHPRRGRRRYAHPRPVRPGRRKADVERLPRHDRPVRHRRGRPVRRLDRAVRLALIDQGAVESRVRRVFDAPDFVSNTQGRT